MKLFDRTKKILINKFSLMKNDVQKNRFSFLLNHISLNGKSLLEIGAQAAPTILKDEADIDYLDYETKEESCKKNFPENQKIWEKVVETDIIVESDDYCKYTRKRYDCVIANHVIEHTDDVILWLQSISKLLKKDGVLFLTIPDKKYSFDKYRPNTSFSHIIADYLLGGKRSIKEHIIEIGVLYDEEYVNKEMNPAKYLNKKFFEEQIKRSKWVGLHRHVFEPENFESKILQPILLSGFVNLKVQYCDAFANKYGEFYCILKKGTQEKFDKEKFLN